MSHNVDMTLSDKELNKYRGQLTGSNKINGNLGKISKEEQGG